MSFQFDAIGVVHSCFKEKFGTPRQPGISQHAESHIEILAPFHREECFRELDQFSHIWVCFVFHQNYGKAWQSTVRPPRLGGNEKIGVFASRSGFRPNPIGISVAPLTAIEHNTHATLLHTNSLDLIEGTPVLDIKPYIPYVDSVPNASAGYALAPPEKLLTVRFSEQAARECEAKAVTLKQPRLRELIIEILELDPRPAYYGKSQQGKIQGLRLYDFDLKWRVINNEAEVISLASQNDEQTNPG